MSNYVIYTTNSNGPSHTLCMSAKYVLVSIDFLTPNFYSYPWYYPLITLSYFAYLQTIYYPSYPWCYAMCHPV